MRELKDLVSVGPAMLRDFKALGVHSVAQLAKQDPKRLFEKLCEKNGPVDICCLELRRACGHAHQFRIER